MSVDKCTCFFMLGSASRKVLAVRSHTSFLNAVYNTTDRRKWLRFGDIMMKLTRDAEVVLRERDFFKKMIIPDLETALERQYKVKPTIKQKSGTD